MLNLILIITHNSGRVHKANCPVAHIGCPFYAGTAGSSSLPEKKNQLLIEYFLSERLKKNSQTNLLLSICIHLPNGISFCHIYGWDIAIAVLAREYSYPSHVRSA